ncbi:GNAT family N-acetyltransferase [Ornithinimicrobium cryptoxanthini]|uniref:GNAT family N-acetyltransferase n=1 Tax=Ornithinimicrobium cryptoxanthini TaxID=2934161 RepID=UPI0021195E4A|nr:GNAT family N-acetyltransferase [Ornithinimicrobium cryptoxanthini]
MKQSDVVITAVPSVPGQEQDRLAEGIAEVGRRANIAKYGDASLADPGSTWAASLGETPYRRRVALVAQGPDGQVVAYVSAGLPLSDNTALAELELEFDPAVDVGSVGRALWERLAPMLRAEGRATAQLWSSHGGASGSGPRVSPVTGVGTIASDATTDLLIDLGFVLEQVERYSVLDVAAVADRAIELLRRAAAQAGPDYRLHSWAGITPVELREQLAVLRARMSVDVPLAELDVEQEVWDAERVLHADQRVEQVGRLQLISAAEHVPTGALVAYTLLTQRLDLPEIAYQDDTLVHGDHRGHRLGMLVKAANVGALERLAPQVARIHTWNADENAHMLAINVELGFATKGAEGGWQLRLAN